MKRWYTDGVPWALVLMAVFLAVAGVALVVSGVVYWPVWLFAAVVGLFLVGYRVYRL